MDYLSQQSVNKIQDNLNKHPNTKETDQKWKYYWIQELLKNSAFKNKYCQSQLLKREGKMVTSFEGKSAPKCLCDTQIKEGKIWGLGIWWNTPPYAGKLWKKWCRMLDAIGKMGCSPFLGDLHTHIVYAGQYGTNGEFLCDKDAKWVGYWKKLQQWWWNLKLSQGEIC